MNTAKKERRFLTGLLAFSLALILGAGVPAASASAQELGAGAKLEEGTLSAVRPETDIGADGTEQETEGLEEEITISMKSSIETPATPAGLGDEGDPAVDTALSGAQGLSLSTASEVEVTEGTSAEGSAAAISMGGWIVILTVSLTISGLIILGVAAGLVYFFRRNWNRWGGEDDNEY